MSLELNKVFAGILTAGIAFMVTGVVGGLAVPRHLPEKSAIQIGDVGAPAGGATPAAAPAAAVAVEPIGPLLASANAGTGERLAKAQCGACHSFNEGGRSGVGPNLYGVVGQPHGRVAGFAYSAALKSLAEPWNYEELNRWLVKPSTYAPGTKMAYAGLASTQQRADIIAYLRSITPGAPNP